jgi:hypothetical protein
MIEHDWPGLTDELWERLSRSVPWRRPPTTRRQRRRGGRPRLPDKVIFEALLWALGGGTLDRLPRRFGSRRTFLRRLKEWAPRSLPEYLWRGYMAALTPDEAQAWRRRLAPEVRRPLWQDLLRVEFKVLYAREELLGPPGSRRGGPRSLGKAAR